MGASASTPLPALHSFESPTGAKPGEGVPQRLTSAVRVSFRLHGSGSCGTSDGIDLTQEVLYTEAYAALFSRTLSRKPFSWETMG